jgi:transposase
VSEVARRHEISPQHLFDWRKAVRHGQLALPADEAAVFVPAMMPAQKPGCDDALDHDRGGWDRGSGRMRRGCRVARGCAACSEGSRMIVPSGAVRVLVATRPVDFRKGMDGLAALVRESLGSDPYSGVIYVFRAKRADRVKLLLWDGTGLVLVAKRLEKNSFRWPQISDGVMRLTSSQLSALLEGLDWTRVRAVRVPVPQATL